MKVKNAAYELTAVEPSQYPEGGLPEIALVGRSNVGKSSLINTLLGRRNLARVGATPGKTRQINFYNIDSVLRLVDLPGYGYANVSKAERMSWGKIVETYLDLREELRSVLLLIDIRHTPTNDDKIMYDWLKGNGVEHIVVATKADKISRSQIKPRLADIAKFLQLPHDTKLIAFSSEKSQGKDELWEEIDSIIMNGI